MDLNGDIGTNMFSNINVSVSANTLNQGTAVPSVNITSTTDVKSGGYRLNYDGSQWQLTRLSDGNTVSGPGPLTMDGMSVDVSAGTPIATDSFLINPARDAAEQFDLLVSDPRKIAVASAIAIDTPSANNGDAVLEGLQANSSTGLPFVGNISLTFDPDALGVGVPGYIVTGGPGGTIAYDPATESTGKNIYLCQSGYFF